MLNKLLQGLRDKVSSGDTVICAVSGGADSMALLWGMYLLKERLGITLQAAHFNHGLRGAESDADAAFVEQFCNDYNIPVFMGGQQVVAGAKGLEAAARDARYKFFDTLDGKIATAHTADDNAETVLLHLIRGTGLKGLGGITPVRGNVIRPMLQITRKDVLEFLEEYSIQYVEDSSNAGDDFLRNRIRHNVMPLLLQENPRLTQDITAMTASLRQDEEYLSSLIPKSADVDVLCKLAPALQSRAISEFLVQSGVKEPSRANIQSVISLLYSQCPSASVNLPGGIVIERNYDKLRTASMVDAPASVELQVPGVTRFGAYSIHCKAGSMEKPQYDRFVVAPTGKVIVRSRKPGDELRLMGGTKSVKRIFTDKKIPATDRKTIPVIVDELGVLAVGEVGANLERIVPDGIEIFIEKI